MAGLLIGTVSQRTGLTVPTIRYYERVGLLSPAARSSSGYRRYTDTAVEELRFIRKAQALGFSLDEIREILTLSRTGQAPCTHVLDLARRHLQAVDQRIAQLTHFRQQLAGEIRKWDGIQQPTCEGLCQIITGVNTSDDDPKPLQLHRRASKGRRTAVGS